jgi:hypothetical protein
MKKNSILMVFLIIGLMSCDKCKEPVEPDSSIDYSVGKWMVNEGAFNGNNASIDVRMPNGSIERDVFQLVNGFPLGDVLQRVVISNGVGYAVLNNSNKLVIFNASTFKFIREITGLDYPRDVAIVDGKIYIAEGALQGKVSCYNANGQFLNEVAVGNGPERLLFAESRLWVLNSGGWLTDNRVQTIDLSNMSIDHTWTVGDRPVDIEYDALESTLFVLSSGEIQYDANWNITGHTDATLSKFNGLSDPLTVVVGINGDHPRSIGISASENRLLLVNQQVAAYGYDLNTLCTQCIIGPFYTIDLDESGYAYLTSVPDFSTSSSVSQYRSSDFSFLKEWSASIGCSAILTP